METKEIPINLYKKLGKIIKTGLKIQKNGYNNFHKYHYMTEADVTDAARAKFAELNIALHTNVLKVEQVSEDVTRAHVLFVLVDLDSGDSLSSVYVGDGQDKGDKGIYKAYSGAMKYFLAKTLMVSTDDDPEKETTVTFGSIVEEENQEQNVNEQKTTESKEYKDIWEL